jgi:hypothetical protein
LKIDSLEGIADINIGPNNARVLCLVSIYSLADASLVFNALTMNMHDADVRYMRADHARTLQGRAPTVVSRYEGQVAVTIMWDEASTPMTDAQILSLASGAMTRNFGAIKAIQLVVSAQFRRRELVVEFDDTRVSLHAIRSTPCTFDVSPFHHTYLASNLFQGFRFDIMHFSPDLATPTHAVAQNVSISASGPAVSVTGRSFVPETPADVLRARHLFANNTFGRRRGPQVGNPRDNRIDTESIRRGLDVRTTVMLRNIPNCINCHELKAMLDKTSFGQFDFMYLRIDFKHGCNVGYAFINFVGPEAIIAFANEHQNRRWLQFNSPKTAEISYASKSIPSRL